MCRAHPGRPRLRSVGAGALVFCLLACITLTTAPAAEIVTTNNELCSFSLVGPIARGDSDQLRALLDKNALDFLNERTTSICLHSGGGSFDEAMELSRLVFERGLSTVIADKSECFSACAIIFMSGVIGNRDLEDQASIRHVSPYRKLSAGGQLGFHAPYLSAKEGKYSKEQLIEYSQEMRKAILALVQLASRATQLAGTEFMKKSLLARILETEPGEIFLIKTISEAARWDIEIYDANERYPQPSNIDGMKNLCRNFHYAKIDAPIPSPAPDLSLRVESYSSKFHAEDGRIIVADDRTGDTVCEVYPREDRTHRVNFFVCSFDYWTSNGFGDCRNYKKDVLFGQHVPSFFLFPPETLLNQPN